MSSLSAFNRPRRVADALAAIAEALERDGWSVAPQSIDTAGLSLYIDGAAYRITFTDEEILYPSQEAYERRDAFIGEPDPTGFNGQESPDDIEF